MNKTKRIAGSQSAQAKADKPASAQVAPTPPATSPRAGAWRRSERDGVRRGAAKNWKEERPWRRSMKSLDASFPSSLMRRRVGRTLTYKEAALKLGFVADYSRAIASVCDLLDAAAAWSGLPLLALNYVRSSDGNHNPKAFNNQGQREYRDAIFQRSISHSFTQGDFDEIYSALEGEFKDDSNVSSWDKIFDKFGGEQEAWARLASGNPLEADALNDFGSDIPDTRISITETYIRNEKVRRAVLKRAKGKCEYCGEGGFKHIDGGVYLECHHIIRLANEGEDRVTNVIALCPNDHREAHFGIERDAIEDEMTAIVASKIPRKKTGPKVILLKKAQA